eukprot:11811721-Ditylum_brightwellii.AAC.1
MQLAKEKVISKFGAEEFCKTVLLDKSNIDHERYKYGATYVHVEVAVSMLEDNSYNNIEVTLNAENMTDEVNKIKIKRSWPKELFPLQKCNSYGADFYVVPKFQWMSPDGSNTSSIWLVSSFIMNIDSRLKKAIQIHSNLYDVKTY